MILGYENPRNLAVFRTSSKDGEVSNPTVTANEKALSPLVNKGEWAFCFACNVRLARVGKIFLRPIGTNAELLGLLARPFDSGVGFTLRCCC